MNKGGMNNIFIDLEVMNLIVIDLEVIVVMDLTMNDSMENSEKNSIFIDLEVMDWTPIDLEMQGQSNGKRL
jgi:hypothetical protein